MPKAILLQEASTLRYTSQAFPTLRSGFALANPRICAAQTNKHTSTTATTLTYVIWAVCSNPKLRDRLVKELDMLPENFRDDDLKTLPFLDQCITEALRCFPVIPGGLPRYVPKEGSELAGYWLPGSVSVTTQAFSLHRNPEVFPNPDQVSVAKF